MSDRAKLVLLRTAMLLLSIIGAVYVFSVIMSVRDGTATLLQIILGVIIAGALIQMNRWWLQYSGTRL
ncbi:MAG: hypothetical protein EA415_06510 [Sphaerobacteraceae bacterium]|nr:MAG: hypothetical protein EA415_06510 [Sphaerobacteraceae bacterium]